MNTAYKCSYQEVMKDSGGILKNKSKHFATFMDAVKFSRMIANTNINIVGKPVIILGKEEKT